MKVIDRALMLLAHNGLDAKRLLISLMNIPRFIRDAYHYQQKSPSSSSLRLHFTKMYPILTDYTEQAGSASGHYFHQDLWAARKIFDAKPTYHIDIGSRIDGFIAHLLTFMPVEVIDIRPLESDVSGLKFVQDDATLLSQFADSSVESISCLHAVEHFGLGRYGDLIDPEGCFKAMTAFARVLKQRGRLYFSVPIGRERVEYNAHRVFSPQTILNQFSMLELVSFAAITDSNKYLPDCSPNDFSDAYFSCGLFEFTKK